ncbi:MAG: AMP-binding protein [Proteobacteria bacterium]|nr:AMP-binding protein [Pseudomonadota bacterium]
MTAPGLDAPLILGHQIEARAAHAELADRTFLVQDERRWSYREFRDQAVRTAHLLRRRLSPGPGAVDDARPGHVAMILENQLEVAALLGGCGYAGFTLFGINPGLRGDTLAGVLDHSRARLLLVDEKFLPELERVRAGLAHLAPENVLVLGSGDTGGALAEVDDWRVQVAAESAGDPPPMDFGPERNLVVIYTSGTTGLPKGINNNHQKLCTSGLGISAMLGLGPDDRGYACMPLFHSNSMFMGLMASFWCGASLAVRERFSASQFVPDLFRYGVSYWNYVGEPVHYVLSAIDRETGGDEERIRREITENPRNRLRFAIGNGASPPDMDRFTRWLGLEEMFELYGSTEAAISTFRKKGDPRGSTGEILDPSVSILREDSAPCPPAELDAEGRVSNYADAVGEICRIAPDTGLFQGYFDDPEANAQKVRDGVFHSGDLGHVVVRDGRRFLYFDGRTDDWIRKDGENFSAAQVARILALHPDVSLAAAYGAPCAVSDELVMAALELRPGAHFDPVGFLAFCQGQVEQGDMDRKWVPDFVRLVDAFEFTSTQKILVRNLKRVHFSRDRLPATEAATETEADTALYWRERGDTAYRPFTADDWRALRAEFERAEKLELLDR